MRTNLPGLHHRRVDRRARLILPCASELRCRAGNWVTTEGMLEAEVQEQTHPRPSPSVETDRVGDAGDDLETAVEVEGPPDPGVQQDHVGQRLAASGPTTCSMLSQRSSTRRLNLGRSSQMALPPRLVLKVSAVSPPASFAVGSPGEPGIRVQREPGAGPEAERKVGLNADPAGAAAALARRPWAGAALSRGAQVETVVSVAHELVAVVEGDVAERRCRCPRG